MTNGPGRGGSRRRPARSLTLLSKGEATRRHRIARTGLTIALVVAIYFLLPLDHGSNARGGSGPCDRNLRARGDHRLANPRIVGSDHPTSRAVEALALTVPLYVLLFATTYFLWPEPIRLFGGPLTRTDAMYFSSTFFTTVGFGDITAKSEPARLVVTIQMWLDLVFLGLVVQLVVNAVKFSQQRRATRSNRTACRARLAHLTLT